MNTSTPSVSSEQKLFTNLTYCLLVTFVVLAYYIFENEDPAQKIEQLFYSMFLCCSVCFLLFFFINKGKRLFLQTIHFSTVAGIFIGVLLFIAGQEVEQDVRQKLYGYTMTLPGILILKYYTK